MHLVVMATAGNQRYIFASGKRQEIVGASDLIARVNETWVFEALADTFQGFDHRTWRIETHEAELLVAAAGRISVLVKDPDAGRRLVTVLTRRALEEAPGLDLCGAVIECPPGELGAVLRSSQSQLGAVRELRPSPEGRFLRLPLVADCASSGLPASGVRREGRDEPVQARSAEAMKKLAAYPGALERLGERVSADRRRMQEMVDRLGLEADWVAVVHADGNGLGEVFRSVVESRNGDDDRAQANALRSFSLGVDGCAKRALTSALERTSGGRATLPVLPLVVGGDDLTVVCEGDVALPFTRNYLEAFEEETARDEHLRPLLDALELPHLGAGAGVAIVKRNYPFHFAYELAEKLATEEAKKVKQWSSALAFVALYESSAPNLDRIRTSVSLSGGSSRSASPYLVGAGAREERARGRTWGDLERRVAALRREDEHGELLIARGAAHDLREGLCLASDVAASRLELLRHRYAGDRVRKRALEDLTHEGQLVWTVHDGSEGKQVTGLLDAMAALQFLPEAR
ncbi:Cas10/Cmr2 second palm domain-containing protein [Nonomuraea sp. NPDC049714]|uniref:Cas10/Cmr2 second palm domain-containing protein n=1 Tax=Nonomuraea sp. NPDC049714 TaxID=3364357 RepID=UPI0037BBE173